MNFCFLVTIIFFLYVLSVRIKFDFLQVTLGLPRLCILLSQIFAYGDETFS